jgi:2-polyprenyl-6-hydroxyphenyl methylase/3-demethylubiquinone-9 3-methyltransferase
MSLHEYYEEYWDRDDPTPLKDPFTPTRIALLRKALGQEDHRILDVGCGSGALVGELGHEGFETIGFDISQRAIKLASQRHPSARFVRHSVEELPWPVQPASQDIVVAFEVLEHLLRPRALIEGARDALRPGGHIALSTPFHGVSKNVVVSLVAFDRHFAPEGDHIRFFTDRALERLLRSRGFAVERIRHFGRFAPLWAGVFVWARKR